MADLLHEIVLVVLGLTVLYHCILYPRTMLALIFAFLLVILTQNFWMGLLGGPCVFFAYCMDCNHMFYLKRGIQAYEEDLKKEVEEDMRELGRIAFEFRGTKDAHQRMDLAREYEDVVERLVYSGHWDECPGPEEQLPDDFMPKLYFEFWGLRGHVKKSDDAPK